jgi:Zn-dependent protease
MIFLQSPEAILGIAIALVVGITFHEFSHAFTADQLGDHRPRAMGRVSLNPTRHIDPLGAIFFALAGFGWGRPVMVNAYALRPGPVGMAIVAAAGPIANLVVAIALAVVYRVLDIAGLDEGGLVMRVLELAVVFNIALGLFNLIPIPPLDGYNLVLPFLPPRWQYTIQRNLQWGFLLLLLLVILPNSPITWLFRLAFAGGQLLTGAGGG